MGEPTDLTPGPGDALLDTHHDVTPDGSTVVTSWLRRDDLVRPHMDLIAIDRATGARRPVASEDAWFDEPACSPDGRWVACTRSTLGSTSAAQRTTLWLVDIQAAAGRPTAGRARPHTGIGPVAPEPGLGT